jgi:chemotaxis protein MotB
MAKRDERPIVIKRRNKARHQHHGGAWKLAYADFMTAMMAFFLLMWLLGSINTAELSGLADYFKMPLRTALLGGKHTGEGASLITAGGLDLMKENGDTRDSQGSHKPLDQGTNPINDKLAANTGNEEKTEAIDAQRMRDLQIKLDNAMQSNPALQQYRQQILIDITRDGLRIQIVDTQNRPMFANASAQVEPYMQVILREIGKALNGVPNKIVLSGHTDANPYAGGEKGYSNWELSSDRANASRRELIAGGMDETKLLRVIGLASTEPLVKDNPLDPTNRRISIIVLNHKAELAYENEGLKTTSVSNGSGGASSVIEQFAPASAPAAAPKAP